MAVACGLNCISNQTEETREIFLYLYLQKKIGLNCAVNVDLSSLALEVVSWPELLSLLKLPVRRAVLISGCIYIN